MGELRAFVGSIKEIAVFSGWSDPEEETGYMWFDSPLNIGGVTEHGFTLHGGCYQRHPNKNVTFELRLKRTPGKKCTPLARLDWRSLKGGHSNMRGRCPAP